MVKFLLFCILLILCWPLALVALVLYPFVWLVLLPFRVVGIAVGGVLELVKSCCRRACCGRCEGCRQWRDLAPSRKGTTSVVPRTPIKKRGL